MDTHKKILVIPVTNLRTSWFNLRGVKAADVQMASLVILKTKTHFKATKNRWDDAKSGDRIPNFLFLDFLLRYSQYFTEEDVEDALK